MTQRRVPHNRFNQERRVFDRLKADCSQRARQEYEQAIRSLLQRYNTTIHENRFIVGGAVEMFTYALLRTVGVDCIPYGDQATGGDILLPNDRKLSVKGSFQGVADIRLLNQMGKGNREWVTATLFIVSGVGIVFGAPHMVAESHLNNMGDAKILRKIGLQALIDNSANVIAMEISPKPPTEMTGFSDKASTAVARQILFEMQSKDLLPAFGQHGTPRTPK